MTKTFEIYFNDLNNDAKKRYLKFTEVPDESDLNHENCPLAIVDLDVEENND